MGFVNVISFGVTPDGKEVACYTLTNANGVSVSITNYGATIVSINVPDRKGDFDDVVLGCDNICDYIKNSGKSNPYFGATIGRYANRIANAKFYLDGKEFNLQKNDGENSLHGGSIGFDKVIWEAEPFKCDDLCGVRLAYLSKDAEEGFSGNLQVTVCFSLTNQNELKIVYSAKTDVTTVVNMTNHSYFNLAGQGSGNILMHELRLNADYFTPVNENLIPTGVLMPVAGTPMDFRASKVIGERINAKNDQLNYANGYDHNWVINDYTGDLNFAAAVYEPKSGRIMDVYTTEPGIQFYTGNFLDGTALGKNGKIYGFREGFCLETQHFPDSPNQKDFPSVVLEPSGKYYQKTVLEFLTE